MKTFLWIIIVCVLVSCSKSDQSGCELVKGTAIIEGKLSNYENASRVLSFRGTSILGDISQTVVVDSLGKFRAEINLSNSQNLSLKYDNHWAYIYIYRTE